MLPEISHTLRKKVLFLSADRSFTVTPATLGVPIRSASTAAGSVRSTIW